jgi:GT2 family glycosyltransferase
MEKYIYIDVTHVIYDESNTIFFIEEILAKTKGNSFLIEFKNSQVLYKTNMNYKEIEGSYEVVTTRGSDIPFTYLCSAKDNFINIDSFEPIKKAELNLNDISVFFEAESNPCSILIPIYGSPQYTKKIIENLKEIKKEISNLDVHISIDFISEYNSDLHESIISSSGVDVIIYRQNDNLGFVDNCNFLFDKAENQIMVLWTSDVKLNKGGISKLIAPLMLYDDVALSTPFAYGGANLEAPISSVLSWVDLDRCLRLLAPDYPEAETNVGYLLGIDNSKLCFDALFDNKIDNGYSDDSDLYYRVVNKGFRGVLVDNMCVYHEHGSSFVETNNRDHYRQENYLKFMHKWGRILKERIGDASFKIDEVRRSKTKKINLISNALHVSNDITFILPTDDRKIGGVDAVFNICESLLSKEVTARVITTNTHAYDDHAYECESVDINDSMANKIISNSKLLVATSHDTVPLVKGFKEKFGMEIAYFVQGPEFSFSSGEFLQDVLTDFKGFDCVWCVSDFIIEMILPWCDKKPKLIPYGPNEYEYYNRNEEREERSIAIQFNGRIDKGADYIAGMIAALKPLGYKFYSFGDTNKHKITENFCIHLGFLNKKEKIDLFNKTEFYMDASHFEGLGLILIESTLCGSMPIYRSNGGSAKLLKENSGGILIGDYGDILESSLYIEEAREDKNYLKQRYDNALSAFKGHSVSLATEKIIQEINNA